MLQARCFCKVSYLDAWIVHGQIGLYDVQGDVAVVKNVPIVSSGLAEDKLVRLFDNQIINENVFGIKPCPTQTVSKQPRRVLVRTVIPPSGELGIFMNIIHQHK
jgi:hypothetical protein